MLRHDADSAAWGYRKLKSFQVAQPVYDVTVRFCDRYIERSSRTHDQMVQAALSGVQNIVEESHASGTSKKMEMELTNVARASLEELKLDHEDFLKQRGLVLWTREEGRRQELIDRRPQAAEDVAQRTRQIRSTSSTFPESAANGALAPVAVATVLLDRQLQAQAKAFERDGGLTERLYRTRKTRRDGAST